MRIFAKELKKLFAKLKKFLETTKQQNRFLLMEENLMARLVPYPLKFLSEPQKKRLERDTKICEAYLALKGKYPKLSRRRICDCLSKKEGVSFSCIYQILNRAHLW